MTATDPHIALGDLTIAVTFKDIRNVHLSVLPPEGRVRIAAPLRTSLDTLRVFAITRLGWIRQQQARLRAQLREPARELVERESQLVWGRRCLLTLVEHDAAPSIQLRARQLEMRLRPGTAAAQRQALLDRWYREQLRAALVPLLAQWQAALGVRVATVHVQRMKTRWGSCNPARASIRLNTELARKPLACLEYIVVHELAHLLQPGHGAGFTALLDHWLPAWRHTRAQLNRLPVGPADRATAPPGVPRGAPSGTTTGAAAINTALAGPTGSADTWSTTR